MTSQGLVSYRAQPWAIQQGQITQDGSPVTLGRADSWPTRPCVSACGSVNVNLLHAGLDSDVLNIPGRP
jgi:hypothetical protein